MPEVDCSDFEDKLIKENDLLLLGFNGGQIYIPLWVVARIERPYLYDPIAESQLSGPIAPTSSVDGITSNTFQPALQLGSSKITAKPVDVFDLERFPSTLYQMFMGIDPPWLRVFLEQPWGVDQGKVPTIGYTPNYGQEGWFDGYLSPLDHPSGKTQMFIVPGLSIGTAYMNVAPRNAYPLLLFWINALRVAVVNDPDLAFEMLTKPGKAKIFTVAGLQSVNWDPLAYYGITGFSLTANKDQVAAGVAQQRGVTTGTRPGGV